VHEQRARVHQVERARGELFGAHVAAEHFEVRQRELGQEAGIQIGRGHAAFRADVLAQPARHRPAPAADLEAASPRRQAEQADSALRERVEALGEQVQAASLMGTGVRKRILRRDIGHLPHANPRESRPASAVVPPVAAVGPGR